MGTFCKPNFKISYSEEDGYDVSFLVSCEGFTSQDDSRWMRLDEANCNLILDSMNLVAMLYGDRYRPSIEKDVDFSRFVFDAIEISYKSFRNRFNSLTKEQCEKFYWNGGSPFLVSSAYNAFLGIFDAFYDDVCNDVCNDARNVFIDALLRVENECKQSCEE